jgi:hypothetical protein
VLENDVTTLRGENERLVAAIQQHTVWSHCLIQ